LTITTQFGRGNEQNLAIDVERQQHELLVGRNISESLRLIAGYRYEYGEVEDNTIGQVINSAPGVPLAAPATLVRRIDNLTRHSLRAGMSLDAALAPEGDTKRHFVSAGLSAVAATGRTGATLVVDTDSGPTAREQRLLIAESNQNRFGPEVSFGYRFALNPRANFEVGYRGTFLYDRASTAADVDIVHGVTALVSYRFGR
jgi:hypothetical protein